MQPWKVRIAQSFRGVAVDRNLNTIMADEEQTTPRVLRLRVGLTQKQLAQHLGKRKETISDWENGKRKPKLFLEEVKLMTEVYQVTLEELIEAFKNTTLG